MKEFIIYIGQASICIGIFFLIYIIFLRSATFFRFNRGFLLTGLIASFIIPAIHFSYDVMLPMSTSLSTTAINTLEIQETSPLEIWHILLIAYFVGLIIQLIRNFKSYKKLVCIIRSGGRTKIDNYHVVDSPHVKSPFTVFNCIAINTIHMTEIEKNLILKHEMTHISQKHWIDLLCCECALLLQWFNPLMWLYVSLLKENHEYLADKAVIDAGISPAVYQAALINQRFQGPVFSFSNSFSSPKQLNRLFMIKKEKTSSWKRIAVLTLIPSFGLFFWLSATPRYVFESQEGNYINQSTEPIKDSTQIIVSDTDPKKALVIVDDKETSAEDFKKMDQRNIESVDVLKNKTGVKLYGEKGKNGVIIIKTKKEEQNPEVNTAPLTFSENKAKPIVFVDGIEVPFEKLEAINPQNVESINVFKDKTAIEMYGEKGKNGVMHITLKKEK